MITAFSLWLLFLLMIHDSSRESDFERQVIDPGIQIGYGLDIGDVDGDGDPDVLLADKDQFVWYRNPDWERFIIADNLTERDNVCLTVRDIDSDGQVEVAVGAQWNPGETSDPKKSGSVHYLIRPEDPTKKWEPVALHHEPTVHRMHWIRTGETYQLVVLPLHGRGNRNGEGDGVKIFAYQMPEDPKKRWPVRLLDDRMHLTHNFDIAAEKGNESLLIGGKEGAILIEHKNNEWLEPEYIITDHGFGEIRKGKNFITGIQPMHGNMLVIYNGDGSRKVLTNRLKQGHALGVADLLRQGQQQIVVGWREPNENNEMGIMLFNADSENWESWNASWIDRNGIACEDLKIADLNGDGKEDIIASGRSSHNLVIYWNKTEPD